MKVIKVDGKIEDYDFGKIQIAVNKAFKSCKKEPSEKLIGQLKEVFDHYIEECEGKCEVPVDEIKDIIENFLIKKNQYDVVKASIKERDRKDKARAQKSKLLKNVREKLEARNIQNQNANVDESSFGGRMGEANRVVAKEMALDYCMTDMAKNNHYNNEIYIHDLDSYAVGMHNCLTIPFDKLLATGFNTRQTDVRPANSVNTAFQLVAVIFQLQSLQQFGGVSASHIDWTMVPYVRKSFKKHFKDYYQFVEWMPENVINTMVKDIEKKYGEFKFDNIELERDYNKAYKYAYALTEKETYQAVEGMYHNLNTLQSRSGNQLPFTSINYGTCTEPEGRMVTKAILDISIAGLGKLHKTPIFPCGIFQSKKGINREEGDKNYDLYQLALKSTAKRLYPNYANCDWSVGQSWFRKDREDKQAYIESLSQKDKNKLIELLEKYPEYKKIFDLEIIETEEN